MPPGPWAPLPPEDQARLCALLDAERSAGAVAELLHVSAPVLRRAAKGARLNWHNLIRLCAALRRHAAAKATGE